MTTATLREHPPLSDELAHGIRELIREEFFQHFDAEHTADQLLDAVMADEAMQRYCVHFALKYLAGQARRDARRGSHGDNHSSRLEAARAARDLDRVLIWVDDHQHKPLRDCTIADLKMSMDLYLRRIGSLEMKVERQDKIAKTMRKHKAEVAGDLPEELLERLWFDA